MTKIIFLGTAGDAATVSTQVRTSGGIIINTPRSQLHLDPGPGAIVRAFMNKVDIREHTTVIVSSNDVLAMGGLLGIMYGMSYGGKAKSAVLAYPESLSFPFASQYVEKLIQLKPEKRIAIQDIEILALATTSEGLGYMFYTPDTVITFTGTTDYTKSIIQQYTKSDILILNMTFPKEDQHPTTVIPDLLSVIKAVDPQLAILTSFNRKLIKHDTLQVARDIQHSTGVQTISARDGLVIQPQTYSAQSKQRRL